MVRVSEMALPRSSSELNTTVVVPIGKMPVSGHASAVVRSG